MRCPHHTNVEGQLSAGARGISRMRRIPCTVVRTGACFGGCTRGDREEGSKKTALVREPPYLFLHACGCDSACTADTTDPSTTTTTTTPHAYALLRSADDPPFLPRHLFVSSSRVVSDAQVGVPSVTRQ